MSVYTNMIDKVWLNCVGNLETGKDFYGVDIIKSEYGTKKEGSWEIVCGKEAPKYLTIEENNTEGFPPGNYYIVSTTELIKDIKINKMINDKLAQITSQITENIDKKIKDAIQKYIDTE